ncbi:MAG: YfaZ family protein [Gammaproteobacteria bacterium]|nr:YfaZ family protein [Gammaproteobacteria bacterium]
MKRYGWLVAASLALCAAPAGVFAQGSGLDLSVSGNSFRAAFDTEITLSGLDLSFEGLHNTDNGDVFGVGIGLRANANPGRSPVTVLIGLKALWLNPAYSGVDSGYSLALGGGVNYVLPQFNRLSFGARIFWAPGVTSFGNAERYLGGAVRAGYRVLPNGTVYVSYRRVAAAFEGTDSLILDNGLNLGFALRF